MPRRPLFLLTLFVVLFLLGASALWFWSAWRFESALAAWKTARHQQDWVVAYEEPVLGGFPFQLKATIGKPMVRTPRGFSWSGPYLDVQSALWSPLTVKISAPGRHNVGWPTGDGIQRAIIEAADIRGRAVFSGGGWMEEAGLSFMQAVVIADAAGGAITADRLQFRVTRLRPEAAEPAHRFDVAAANLVLPPRPKPALGREVASISIAAELEGRLPTGPLMPALAEWQATGGVLEVREFVLDWGPLEAEGDGTFTFDERMRPEAAFTARLAGLDPTLAQLSSAGIIEPSAAMAARLGVLALAERDPETGKRVLEVPVTIQNGIFHLGPVPLFPIPAIQ